MRPHGPVIRLAEARIAPAGEVLARAFFDDPLMVYTLPDPADRTRLLPWHFRALLRYGVLFGEVYTTGASAVAAIWLTPDDRDVTPDRFERAGLHELPNVLGARPWSRFMQVIDQLGQLHVRAIPGRHWYLMVLGVEPAGQRRGLGGALLGTVLARADADGLPCYLETLNPANVDFYRRRDFDVVVDDVEPASGLHFWTLRRDPRR